MLTDLKRVGSGALERSRAMLKLMVCFPFVYMAEALGEEAKERYERGEYAAGLRLARRSMWWGRIADALVGGARWATR
jgi:hypothetical protein